ncbi:MAG TPA: universal stress protein [Pseudonocardiaceae bacterium]
MPGPVVIGHDGGPSAPDALALGLRCATLTGARVLVAVVYPAPAPIGPGRVDAEWVAERRGEAAVCLERAREQMIAFGVPAGDVDFRAVASTSAAHGLSDLAEAERAGLVVLGSAARGEDGRTRAGSTAHRLLHGATSPVAVAPRGTRDRRWNDPPVIGVAYVDTPEARTALAVAADLATAAGATLRVCTVLAGEAPVLPWLIGTDAEHAFTATALDAFQGAVEAAIAGLPERLRATGEVLRGDVVDALAELSGVDLLVCGSRGYGPVRSVLLGGVSARLVRRARSPLVIVPRGA